MSQTKKIPGTETKSASPKPFAIQLEKIQYAGFNFAGEEHVKIPVRAEFKRTSEAYKNACRLRPRQYAATIAAKQEAYTDWRDGKEVKIPAEEAHEIYATKEAKISNLRVLPGFNNTTVTFMLLLPAEFAEASAKIRTTETLSMEIAAPQLSLV